MRSGIPTLLLLLPFLAAVSPCSVQSNPRLKTFFHENIGLSQDEITAIQSGTAVAKALPSRTPAEVFLFGAVYVHAHPWKYVQYFRDFDRRRKLPNYKALGVFGNPPQLSDVKGLSFDDDDIQALRDCAPANCRIQLPAKSIEEFHRSIDWSAPNVNEQVNRFLQEAAVQRLMAYQSEGNGALGVYNDKRNPAEVAQQFAYMLSYDRILPAHLPEFYHYLLAYPNGKPANVDDQFYWAKVKFGLKPILRVVHVLTMRGSPASDIAYAIAEKQLYSSHYFETALDLTYCIRGSSDPNHPGFYLIMAMGSEQAGLTGVRGSIIRKVAVGRSVQSLQSTLMSIKNALEAGH